jgi:predicted nicotinamide N-methyase
MPKPSESKDSGKKGGKDTCGSGKDGSVGTFADGAKYNNLIAALTANPYTYRFQAFGESHQVVITQSPQYGIGGVLWDCEQVLASYVASTPDRWNSASCIELGAGTGMAAIVAWRLGAFAVSTDLPEVVTDIMVANVQANIDAYDKKKRKTALIAAPLAWGVHEHAVSCEALCARARAAGLITRSAPAAGKKGDVAQANATPDGSFDFVIAADVIYHSEQHEPLFNTLLQLVKPHTTFIFVHRRRFENDSNFIDLIRSGFKEVKATPVAQVEPRYPKDNLTIYEFRSSQT